MTLPNGIVASYTYDDASRLTGIGYAKGATVVGDLAYTYDAAGRRSTVTGSLARVSLPAALTSATYNVANQPTKWGSATVGYDANGNMTADGSQTYVWNARDELVHGRRRAVYFPTSAAIPAASRPRLYGSGSGSGKAGSAHRK